MTYPGFQKRILSKYNTLCARFLECSHSCSLVRRAWITDRANSIKLLLFFFHLVGSQASVPEGAGELRPSRPVAQAQAEWRLQCVAEEHRHRVPEEAARVVSSTHLNLPDHVPVHVSKSGMGNLRFCNALKGPDIAYSGRQILPFLQH